MKKKKIDINKIPPEEKEFLQGLIERIYDKCTESLKLDKINSAYIALTISDIVLPVEIIGKQLCSLLDLSTQLITIDPNNYIKKKYDLLGTLEFRDIFTKIITSMNKRNGIDEENIYDKTIFLCICNIITKKNNSDDAKGGKTFQNNKLQGIINNNINAFDISEVGKRSYTYKEKETDELKKATYKHNRKEKIENIYKNIPEKVRFLFDIEDYTTQSNRGFELSDLLYHINEEDLKEIIDNIIKEYRDYFFGESKFKTKK